MKKRNRSMAQLFFISTLLLGSVALGVGEGAQRDGILKGRIVAVGIPGASAISSVPPFLPGGLHAVETYLMFGPWEPTDRDGRTMESPCIFLST